ncbi:MAG: restriction endonuclease subunit S [Lachnospiraceae bacterium]|nr:restriction endonuclease subunit S [Lachnospiraceae bacterium]
MLKAYEKYQEMGLPWLEQVPAHWGFLRNKNIFVEKKNVVGNSREYKLLSLTKKGIIIRDISTGKGKFPKDFEGYKIVEEGDIVFCLFDVDETPRTVGLSSYKGMITGAYNVFNVRNINSEFIQYYYIAFDNIKAFKPLYTGLRKVIQASTFMATKIPVPPRLEQEQIVHYLNRKVFAMNHFVNQKKQQIRLLDELKKAIICKYALVGIYDNRDMQTSEYPWINKFPVGWKETRAKNILKKLNRSVRKQDKLLICSNSGKVFFRGDSKLGLVADSEDIYQGVRKGDLLIHGMDTWHGAIAISGYDGKCTPVVHVCDGSENKEYVAYYLRALAFLKVYKKISNGVRENTSDFRSWAKVGDINVLVPPRDEQDKIAEILNDQCRQIENFIASLEKELAFLINTKNCSYRKVRCYSGAFSQ